MATSTHLHPSAIKARQILEKEPLFLDTETTGLGNTDEIVEIAVIDALGTVMVDTLVKPSRKIPADVIKIHGITNEMVQKAPAWPILWTQIRSMLIGRVIVAYNAEFDLRMMEQSYTRYRLTWKEKENLLPFDLLRLYSEFRGTSRFFSLDEAGRTSGIALPNAHRSLADTLLARALLFHIAGVNP